MNARRTSLVLLVLLIASSSLAQRRPSKIQTEATKFDEFGSLGHCDLTARLDNFTITLQETPSSTGHIVYYGPDDDGAAKGTLGNLSDYLVNMRGLAEDRITTMYGGVNDDLKQPRIQLWIVPAGAVTPEPVKYKNALNSFTGMFDEHEAWDSVGWGEPEVGPGIGHTAYSSFEQMLLKRKSTVGYIVAFNGKDAAPGAWRRVATSDFEDLRKAGVEATRLRMVYGGSAKETKVQWWITPAGTPPPVKSAGEEPLPDKTVMLGDYPDRQLAEAKSERWALNSLLEELQRDESLRACIIVKLESDKEEEEEGETSTATAAPIVQPESVETTTLDAEYTEPDDPEARKTALLKLVEKWKVELTTTHKIRPERIVVLFADVPKYYQNTVETWIVPRGQPLPDPKAAVEEAEVEEEPNTEKP
jgi:hypothetical protein